jgi:hypothetical protein
MVYIGTRHTELEPFLCHGGLSRGLPGFPGAARPGQLTHSRAVSRETPSAGPLQRTTASFAFAREPSVSARTK